MEKDTRRKRIERGKYKILEMVKSLKEDGHTNASIAKTLEISEEVLNKILKEDRA